MASQPARSEDKNNAKPSMVGGWQQKLSTQNIQGQESDNEAITSANDKTGMEQPGDRTSLVKQLLKNNQRWSKRMNKSVPGFFSHLAQQQTPDILWIGCSDSRVPANQIIDLPPGEVFVHRNIANVFNHTDFNALSVLQFAVDVLKVKHVIVCGHYGCGGVAASIEKQQLGLIDNWLRNIKDVYDTNFNHLQQCVKDSGATEQAAKKLVVKDRLTELNVARSVRNVCATTVIQNAWMRNQPVTVHGWCYRLSDGIIKDLDIEVSSVSEVEERFQMTDGAFKE